MHCFQYIVVDMGKESFFQILILITSPFPPPSITTTTKNYTNKCKEYFSNYSRNKYLMQAATALNNPK